MSTTAMWLLLAVVVILILFFSVLYKRRFTVHELALTGVMAALSLVAYLFFRAAQRAGRGSTSAFSVPGDHPAGSRLRAHCRR